MTFATRDKPEVIADFISALVKKEKQHQDTAKYVDTVATNIIKREADIAFLLASRVNDNDIAEAILSDMDLMRPEGYLCDWAIIMRNVVIELCTHYKPDGDADEITHRLYDLYIHMAKVWTII